MISSVSDVHNGQIQRQKVDEWLPQVGGRGVWEVMANGYRVSFGMMKCSKINCGDGCITVKILKKH